MKTVAPAAVLALALAACGGPVDADSLARARHAAGATAAEASLLIDETTRGDVTLTYARIHREKLTERMHDAAEDLDRPAPRALAAEADRTRRLASALSDALQHLGDALGAGEPDLGSAGPLPALKQSFSTIRHDSAAGTGS